MLRLGAGLPDHPDDLDQLKCKPKRMGDYSNCMLKAFLVSKCIHYYLHWYRVS